MPTIFAIAGAAALLDSLENRTRDGAIGQVRARMMEAPSIDPETAKVVTGAAGTCFGIGAQFLLMIIVRAIGHAF